MFTEQELDHELEVIFKALEDPVDHVTALCAASGVTETGKVDTCKWYIDSILANLRRGGPSEPLDVLHYIYQSYCSGQWFGSEEISFHSAVSNFANPDIEYIGNCLTRSSIFYVLAHRLGVPVGFVVEVGEIGHCSIRTLDANPVTIDLNEGVGVPRYEDEEDLTFPNHLGLYYLNRLETVQTPEEKAQLCRGVLKLSPDRPEGYSELAAVHICYNGNPRVAIQLCEHAITLSSGAYPGYRANLVLAYNFAGRKDLAFNEFERLRKDFPNFDALPRIEQEIS